MTTALSHRVRDWLPPRGRNGSATAPHTSGTPSSHDIPTAYPAALAVDLGSGCAQIWSPDQGIVTAPTSTNGLPMPARLVQRGRVVNGDRCVALLSRLLQHYPQPMPERPVVVACRPVLATLADQNLLRQVLTTVFKPSMVRFIDTIRAAAIGAGAAAGVLLIVDVGAQLIEVALLSDGQIRTARRANMGTHDLARYATPDTIANAVSRLVSDLRGEGYDRRMIEAALRRGVLLVGDGATRPEVPARMAAALGTAVRPAAIPRTSALRGAGIAALATGRHPGARAA